MQSFGGENLAVNSQMPPFVAILLAIPWFSITLSIAFEL